MHCYRVTTFHPDHPVYTVFATQQFAFAHARLNTTDHRSPVVALIDLPIDKASIVAALNDPAAAIGNPVSLKSWEFYKRGTQHVCREIEPNTGEPLEDVVRKKTMSETLGKAMDRAVAARKARVHESVREQAKSNPTGWPAVLLKNKDVS